MADSPFFSVVTVCRNEREKIRTTCESICGQSYRDFEWIVIDGASTDETLDVLREYEDQMAVLISEPDAGIYNAMNKGIKRASGEYVVFMNGGDYFSGNDVLQFVADAPEAGILYGDLLFDGPEPSIAQFPDRLPPSYLLNNMLPHQASFIRRELFERYGGYDESFKIAGDYDLFARLLEIHRVSCFHVPYTLAVFNGEGISKDLRYRALRKQENHRVRKTYFPRYRFSLKGLKEEIRSRRRKL